MANVTCWWGKNAADPKKVERLRYEGVTASSKTGIAIKATDDGTRKIAPRNNAFVVGQWSLMGDNTRGLGWVGHKTLHLNVTELYYVLTLPRLTRETEGTSKMLIDVYEYNLIIAFDLQDIYPSMNAGVKDYALSDQSKHADYTTLCKATSN